MAGAADDYRARAMILWPRLDPVAPRRTGGDPIRVLHLVEARTVLPSEAILAMLLRNGRRPGKPSPEG
jgi:hypothetical protein